MTKEKKPHKTEPIEKDEPEVKTLDGELGDGEDQHPKDPPGTGG